MVRGSDEAVVVEVRETRHGPILDSYALGLGPPHVVEGGVRRPYALRWVGAEHGLPPSTLLRMAQANDFEAFRAAVRDWGSPGQNMVYADVDGTIGYQCTGRYPVRRSGDGTMPVPGWTAEHEWDGFIAFEDLPWAVNPESGFLATANNRIHDAAYPHLIGHDWLPPSRIRRIGELLAASAPHSRETFAAMHADTVSIPARELALVLSDVEPVGERQREAIGGSRDGTAIWPRTRRRRACSRCGACTSPARSCSPASARSSSTTTTRTLRRPATGARSCCRTSSRTPRPSGSATTASRLETTCSAVRSTLPSTSSPSGWAPTPRRGGGARSIVSCSRGRSR